MQATPWARSQRRIRASSSRWRRCGALMKLKSEHRLASDLGVPYYPRKVYDPDSKPRLLALVLSSCALFAALFPRPESDQMPLVATVATLMATGAVVGYWLKMYPIETAIVNACHSGQGGTGDVAILTAANRDDADTFRSDRHPYRRGDYGNNSADRAVTDCLAKNRT